MSTIDGDFGLVNEADLAFNKRMNTCWGQKIAITADNIVRPCIYSEISIGNLLEVDIGTVIDKMKEEYWSLTKDKVEKCNNCEFRYVCFDCREIARKVNGNLYSTNPYCNYEPLNGEWNFGNTKE